MCDDTGSGNPFERVAELRFENLVKDIKELQERVRHLESTLARGVMLLIANLTGVAMMLAREVLHRS